ncbi:unnamed protein product [Citrullus colocynthis]|uniref:MORF/ORRM1/DAG-like MORF domain-containing protein n=1 Tax=Citrullus colocynthis TaxID=252529 RepID=A0ABP0YEF3_9ROSI
MFSRSFLTATGTAVSASSHSYFSLMRRLRPLTAIVAVDFRSLSPAPSVREFATSYSLHDPNPNWSNRPPKEPRLPDGCDSEHWLVVMEKPEDELTRDEIIDSYIKTLAMVVGRTVCL